MLFTYSELLDKQVRELRRYHRYIGVFHHKRYRSQYIREMSYIQIDIYYNEFL